MFATKYELVSSIHNSLTIIAHLSKVLSQINIAGVIHALEGEVDPELICDAEEWEILEAIGSLSETFGGNAINEQLMDDFIKMCENKEYMMDEDDWKEWLDTERALTQALEERRSQKLEVEKK